MIFTRLLSFLLRFAEFVCAAVVLGIMAYELHLHHKYHLSHGEPFGREIYTLVISVISVLLSLLWLLPFLHNIMHYPMDFILSAAWFAAFGVLVNWLHKTNCGSAFGWGGIQHLGSECNRWRAAEAFSFLSAIFWLASCIIGFMVYHRMTRTAAVDANTPVGTTTRRRRWGRRY